MLVIAQRLAFECVPDTPPVLVVLLTDVGVGELAEERHPVEKSVLFFGAFFGVFRSQFRSLADRWCFSAIGHVGSVFREGSAGAYVILCSHTML